MVFNAFKKVVLITILFFISVYFQFLNKFLFSHWLYISKIKSPNNKELIINKILVKPSVMKEILIRIVEIINPEFLIMVWKASELKNEKINNNTSTRIKIWKNSSKNILLIDDKPLGSK